MDRAAQLAGGINIEPIKEPKGFIKILEFILAIFAFATTTSHKTSSSFDITCPDNITIKHETIKYGYPYRLSNIEFKTDYCGDASDTKNFCCDYNSAPEFYVFVGVMAFLYSLAAVILYIVFDESYRTNDRIPKADFIITIVLTALWLIGSAAWADGLNSLKYNTKPSEWFADQIPECSADAICTQTGTGNFASLNVSVIFGFLNMVVWGGNLWFLYKETTWFKVENTQPDLGTPQQDSQHI